MPNAFSDVNFIPDEVVSNRKHDSQIKSLNKFAIAAMIISLLLGFGLLGYNIYSKRKITELEAQVSTEQAKIEDLNEFAESGYKLGLRLAAIKKILNERPYYGKVIEKLYEEMPRGISISDIQVSEKGSVVLTGTSSPNYIPIAVLQDNLKNSDSGYFSEIRLRSASLDKNNSNVSFTIDFLIDLTKIYEPI